jgi:hypothetical protein
MEGRELPVRINIDEWSSRRLTDLGSRLKDLLNKVEDSDNFIETAVLRNMLDDQLAQVEKEIADTVAAVRLQVLDSQLRVNIADIVIQALNTQGFALQEAGYEESNKRAGYAASLRSLGGDEIVVHVTPGNDFGENSLQLDSFDADRRTRHELVQRAEEISQALKQRGLTTGPLTTQPEPHRERASHDLIKISEAPQTYRRSLSRVEKGSSN